MEARRCCSRHAGGCHSGPGQAARRNPVSRAAQTPYLGLGFCSTLRSAVVVSLGRALSQARSRRSRHWAFCYSGCSRAGKSPIPDQDSESSIRKPVRIGIPYSSVDQFLHVNDVTAERRCAAAHGRERGRHPRPDQALLGLWSTHGIFLRRRGRTVLSTVHVPGGGVGAAAAHAAVYGVRRAAPRRVSLVS
eukprot:COSAG03_NODE_3026_length_2280_cov_2.324926_3_plen_191_part_00